MSATAWIALGALAFTVITTVAGAVAGGILWIGKKFDDHEARAQQRRTDNLERFGTIERQLSVIIRNKGFGRTEMASDMRHVRHVAWCLRFAFVLR